MHLSRCCSIAAGLIVTEAAGDRNRAVATQPSSKVFSVESCAAGDSSVRPWSIESVDLLMARSEMQQLRNNVSLWMQQQQQQREESEDEAASPEIQVANASSLFSSSSPP